MANMVLASIYGENDNDWKNSNGVLRQFAVGTFQTYPKSVALTGATAITVIEVLPTGLNQLSRKFNTTATQAAILASANAPLA